MSSTPRRTRSRLPALLGIALSVGQAFFAIDGFQPYDGQMTHELDRKVENLTESMGLSNQRISDFSIDAEGKVWVASWGGLYIYDGFRTTHYDKSAGFPSNFLRCIAFTRSGETWIGTDQGPGIFENGQFNLTRIARNLAGPNIRRIIEDRNGALWFCSDLWPWTNVPGGLTKFADGKFEIYRQEDGLPSDHIFSFFQDSAGGQYAIANQGIAVFENGKWGPITSEFDLYSLQKDEIWKMDESSLFGTFFSDSKAIYYRKGEAWTRETHQEIGYRIHPRSLSALNDGSIIAVGENDGNAYLLLRAENGWQRISDRIDGMGSRGQDTRPKKESDATRIAQASDSSIWISTETAIYRFQNQASEFANFLKLGFAKGIDAQGRLWFLGSFDSPTVYKENGRFHFHPTFDGWVEIDPQGRAWGWDRPPGVQLETASVEENRIRLWEETETIFTHEETGLYDVAGYADGADGQPIFFGTDKSGIPVVTRYDSKNWQAARLDEYQELRLLSVDASEDSSLWLKFIDERHFDKLRIVKLAPDGSIAAKTRLRYEGLNASVPQLSLDHQGDLWLSGRNGLYRMDSATLEWTRVEEIRGDLIGKGIRVGDGMIFPIVASSTERNRVALYRGGQWTTRELPLIQYKPSHSQTPVHGYANLDTSFCHLVHEETAIYFAVKDGLELLSLDDLSTIGRIPLDENLRAKALLRMPEGDLWATLGRFNSNEKTVRFRSDGIEPETLVTNFPESLRRDAPLHLSAEGRERYMPIGQQNNFIYSWRFGEEEWTPFAPLPTGGIDISRLKPGPHTFEIRAMDKGGEIDPTPTKMALSILPIPLQEQGWFKTTVLVVVILIILLGAIAIVSARKLARINARLEDLVSERTIALQQTTENAEHLAKNAMAASEAKSQFLAVMSHELRTPMNAVIGFTDILLGEEMDEEQRELLELISSNAHHLVDIITDILDFSSSESGALTATSEIFDLGAMLNDTVDSLRQIADGKGISLELQISEDIPRWVNGNRKHLRQILSNLLNNAIKFTAQGWVRLDVKPLESQEESCRLQFEVADTGIGVPDDQKQKVFEPFMQADFSNTREFEGTGLGLAICKNLAKLVGGELSLTDRPGGGSIFKLTVELNRAKDTLHVPSARRRRSLA